jgi:GTP-binding protein HflX
MKRLWGETRGLKADQIRRLENLYRRRVPPEQLITQELCRDLGRLSHEIQRQVALLIDRSGKIAFVLVGDPQRITIPELDEYRAAPGRLRGVRCIHTHLKGEALTDDDLTDLSLLHLDIMASVTLTPEGLPYQIHWAHILPGSPSQTPYEIRDALWPHELAIGCADLIQALEREMAQLRPTRITAGDTEQALLVSISTAARKDALDSLTELAELSQSGGIMVVDTILQLRKQIDTRFLMGRGKLNELAIRAMQLGVTMIIFDQELNPSQIKSITDHIELKVIDRTQLILDIFAQRARSREGKLQVELAQLKYLLPRLVTKNTAMSRLTGGIGGRGPGETKLEINRRRVRDRIHRLENTLKQVQKQRKQQRRKRESKGLPIISIVGYTNAGKSTLLNTLTQSQVQAESQLFATLDPSSRRLRFPRDVEVIITDTVGFIRNLPQDLMVAFRATLEELESADLLLHVIDISNPRHSDQIRSVEKILQDLELTDIPQIRVLNKIDRIDTELRDSLIERLGGVAICARDKTTLLPLVTRMAALTEETMLQSDR